MDVLRDSSNLLLGCLHHALSVPSCDPRGISSVVNANLHKTHKQPAAAAQKVSVLGRAFGPTQLRDMQSPALECNAQLSLIFRTKIFSVRQCQLLTCCVHQASIKHAFQCWKQAHLHTRLDSLLRLLQAALHTPLQLLSVSTSRRSSHTSRPAAAGGCGIRSGGLGGGGV